MKLAQYEDIWNGRSSRAFVIAEIGKGFIQSSDEKSVQEHLRCAMELVDAAASSGADAVKFQTHCVDDEQANIRVTSPHFQGAERYAWVKRNTQSTPLEDFWAPLAEYCKKQNVFFFSTPMSRGAAKLLSQLHVELWKIGSGDILDFVLLDYIRRQHEPVIISSGMSTLEELDTSVQFITEHQKKLALMHCVSRYPCPPEELRLGTIRMLQERYALPIGFSDHSLSLESTEMAVSLGARIIEKHFSLSRTFWGSDHKVSLEPREFEEMMRRIRDLEQDEEHRQYWIARMEKEGILHQEKELHEEEQVFRKYFRKSLVASRDIARGEILSSEDIYAMRPAGYLGGLPSEKYGLILGQELAEDIKKYEVFTNDHLVHSEHSQSESV